MHRPKIALMLIWGPYLYQRDADLDILDLIADEAAGMFLDPDSLRCPLMPELFSLRFPIDKASVVEELNNGIFQRLLRRFKHSDLDMAVILTATVGMELGVKFKDEDTLMVKMVVMKAEMGVERREQMIEALEGYRNDGTVWDFKKTREVRFVDDVRDTGDEREEIAEAMRAVEKESESTAQKPLPILPHENPTKHTQIVQSPPKELKSAFKKPGQEKNVAFRLPKSKSHPALKSHWRKDSKDIHIKNLSKKSASSKKAAKESIFAQYGRGGTMDDEKDLLPIPLGATESIFRLPAPKPMVKVNRKESRKLT